MFRFLSALFLLAAAAVAVVDLWPVAPGDGEFRLNALGEWWFWAHKDTLQALQPAVERHLSPALWDPGIQTLLEWPFAIELAVLGILFRLPARPPPSRGRKRESLDFNRRRGGPGGRSP
jgi:hypothetical protein